MRTGLSRCWRGGYGDDPDADEGILGQLGLFRFLGDFGDLPRQPMPLCRQIVQLGLDGPVRCQSGTPFTLIGGLT